MTHMKWLIKQSIFLFVLMTSISFSATNIELTQATHTLVTDLISLRFQIQ